MWFVSLVYDIAGYLLFSFIISGYISKWAEVGIPSRVITMRKAEKDWKLHFSKSLYKYCLSGNFPYVVTFLKFHFIPTKSTRTILVTLRIFRSH